MGPKNLKLVLSTVQGKKKKSWYLDSGCSRHMTGDKSLLKQYEERSGPRVTFGDDSKGHTRGYGNVEHGDVIFTEVALVDGLKHNLLSVSQLCDKGFHVTFKEDQCLVSDKESGTVILTGKKKRKFVHYKSHFFN